MHQIWDLAHLAAGQVVNGPAVLLNNTSTIVIEPGECWSKICLRLHDSIPNRECIMLAWCAINQAALRRLSALAMFVSLSEMSTLSRPVPIWTPFNCRYSGTGRLLTHAPQLLNRYPIKIGSMACLTTWW